MAKTKAAPAFEPVTLQAGEKTYHLALGWNELVLIEKEFDLGIFQIVNRFSDGTTARLTDFDRLVTAVIAEADGKHLSPAVAAEVLQIAGPEAVTEAAAAALQQILNRLGTTKAA